MNHLMRWLHVIPIVFLVGCDRNTVFAEKHDFPNGIWVFDNQAKFDFEITDTDRSYNILVHVRNSGKYSYQNIYLQYYLEDEEGKLISKELKNIQLFNAKTGVPVGTGLGDVYDVERSFLKDYTFGAAGKYSFRIDQFMRQDSLPGILAVGLRIQYSE